MAGAAGGVASLDLFSGVGVLSGAGGFWLLAGRGAAGDGLGAVGDGLGAAGDGRGAAGDGRGAAGDFTVGAV